MGTLTTQSSSIMKGLLVFAAVAAVSIADEAAPVAFPYHGFGFPYAGFGYGGFGYGLGLHHAVAPLPAPEPITYTPQLIKHVAKEVEIPVKTLQYAVAESACKNVFGFPVPCLQDGEARKKRAADEEAAAPAVLPFPYAGFGYGGLLGYGGFHGYPYAYPQVKIGEPEVTEVEVPHYVYKPVVEKVALPPLCHNGLESLSPVPCKNFLSLPLPSSCGTLM